MTQKTAISLADPNLQARVIRAALYLRASSRKKTRVGEIEEYRQRPEIQEERVRQLCQQRGWPPRESVN